MQPAVGRAMKARRSSGVVDIEAETRQRKDPGCDALRPRGVTVGLETVVAEGEAQHAGRRAEHAVGVPRRSLRWHQGHGRPVVARDLVRRQDSVDLLSACAGHVARHLEQTVDPSAVERRGGPLHRRALAVAGGLREHPRTVACSERGGPLVPRHHDDVRHSRHTRKGLQHVLRHGEGEALALGRAKEARQPLLGIARVLDRKDRPDRHIAIPWAIPRALPRAPASRMPVRDARKKAETCQTKRAAGPGHTPAQAMVRRTAASTSSTFGM